MVYRVRATAGPAGPGKLAEDSFSVPGMIVAATWALGLLIGLVGLATGHASVAVAALVLAVISPWIGLVWKSRGPVRKSGRSGSAAAMGVAGL
ncbi:hypothetical protein MB901379_04583 [Mycobacterium basiliense]|uniref:Uncharacterized protein n=1 Tax=Mycobacterium basiliense TaxID=2094119 RepID=A0A447GKH9_9MYCO|nr:hypothetical protein [Mycobacterium basiliense]VDM90971.1 hypothetical protein MB901379_04583 [Mycobacterium basiliense]